MTTGTNIRVLPPVEPQVRTGPIRFGDDWPGIFIRGDETQRIIMMCENLIALLESCRVKER